MMQSKRSLWIQLCGGPKKSSCISFMVQIIFSFWSFEISEGILRNKKFVISSYSFSNQFFYIFVLIILAFASTILLKGAKLQYFSLAPFFQIRTGSLKRLK